MYLEEDIGGEHKGEADTGEEWQVGQPGLGPSHHELLVINERTRPGVENVKPKGWFKYSLQRDKGVVLDCSTMSLSTWETYIWSNLH